MSTAPVLLLAASGLAREALAVLRRTGRTVLGFLDDDQDRAGTEVAGLPVLGPVEAVVEWRGAELVLCAGRGSSRARLADRLAELGVGQESWTTVVDPTVWMPASCSVGAGSILLAGTVLTADVTVGRHVVCMPNVTLTHDDAVHDFATLAAGVTLGGGVVVGESAYLGMNSAVRERVRVGAGATLGMGAVLLEDIPPGETWAGVPARRLGTAGARNRS